MAMGPRKSDLAIKGGKPVNTKPWGDGPFHFNEEISALKKLLSGPALPLARGKAVMAYREGLKKLYGMKFAIPTSSGSTAIHVALAAAGIGAGDEVILSPLTDYGSVIGIFQLNAIPVFADVQPNSLLMDVDSVASRITPHTKAIMPVHNGGYAVDIKAVMKLARSHDLIVMEDCAQAHLASIKGKYLGTFGQLGAWSTNESKHMKSGEGGFILTNSRKMAERAELFSDKCYPRFSGAPKTPAFPALNVRLSDVNAALALAQLKRVPKWIQQRQAFGESFEAGIQGIPGVVPHPQPKGAKPSYWWAMFVVAPDVLGLNAQEFCKMVAAEGIPASATPQRYVVEWEVFRTLHDNPNAFNSYRPGRLKKRSFPLEACPNAQTYDRAVCAIRVTQHNTRTEAKLAAKAIRKVAGTLLGRKV